MVQALAHQHYGRAGRHQLPQLLDTRGFQSRFQKIFEEFLAQQIQPVAAHSAQHGVQQPRGERSIRDVKERPRQRQHRHAATPRPALRKGLRVPRKERHRPHCRQIQQAALHAPEHRFARGGVRPWLRLGENLDVKNWNWQTTSFRKLLRISGKIEISTPATLNQAHAWGKHSCLRNAARSNPQCASSEIAL